MYFFFFFFLAIGDAFIPVQASQLINTSNQWWPPQVVRWKNNDKELIYIAVDHPDDMASPTHKKIKNLFETEKPDVFVMEGFCSQREGISPQRLKEKSTLIAESGSGKCNDNLYGAYLATKNNIPFIGPELPDAEQVILLQEKGYTFEDIVFYMLVMEIPYLFRDGDFETHTQKFTPETWKAMCEQYMHKNIASYVEQPVPFTYEDFLQWWEKHFHKPLDMEKEFKNFEHGCLYMEPCNAPDACITQKMAYFFHKNRDDYIFKKIKEITQQYNKVLVLYGSNHLRDQWKQLTATYGDPVFREKMK